MVVATMCKEEYSFEGGLAAQYNLRGSPQQCEQAAVNGTYTAGTSVGDSLHSVTVFVDVSRKGSYLINTPTVDGISFTASGVFKDTCSNCSLSLVCHGTPDSAGIFTFPIPGNPGCYFMVTIGNLRPATYTFAGAPGDCSNPAENGQYAAGLATTAENTVTINIQVTSLGQYNITTDTANGFFFSATGSFNNLGVQTVSLKASGTPREAELSQLTLHTNGSECTFYVPVVNREPIATYVLQSGVINNILYCSPGSVQGTYTAGIPLNSTNTLTVNAYVTVAGNFTIATTTQNGIKFSYTGTFSTTGAQDVVLKGTGTPLAIGTYTFTPMIVGPAPLGGRSCGLEVGVK